MQQGIKRGLAAVLSAVLTMSLLLNTFSIGVFAEDDSTVLADQIVAQLEHEGVSAESEGEMPEESPVASAVPTQQPEATEEPQVTAQPEATGTPAPSEVPEPSASAEPTEAPMPTASPEATETPVPTASPEMTVTPTPAVTEVPEQLPQQLTEEELKQQIEDLLEQSYSLTEMTEEELEETLEEIDAIAATPMAMAEDGQTDAELQDLLDQLADAQAAMEDMRMAWQAKREGWLDQLPQTGKENSWRYQNGTRLGEDEDTLDLDLPDGVSTFSAGGYWGIDVSHHQGVINWEAVKAAGIDFAVIRCGYGMNLTEQDDKQWSRNVSECERLGIPYGVYFYSYAMTADMAVEEGAHAVRLLEGHTPDLPVFYDLEENRQLVLGNSGLAEIARIFCDIVGSKGYEVGVYASRNWWQYYLTDAVFENWYRWVAEWNPSCNYNGRYEMWQYTDKGTINGINGYVDMDYWYGSLFRPAHPVAVEEGTYIIHSAVDYGYVLDVRDAGKENGANAQLYSANESAAQQFQIKSVGNNCYTLQNVNSGKLLDIQEGRMASGTNVQQWEANGSNAQQWYFEDAGDGFYYIRAKDGDFYLDVAGGAASNGANVQIWTGNQSTAQKFWLEKVENPAEIQQGIYTIQALIGSNMVLDISGESTANGANAQLYTNNGSIAQQFVIYPVGQGYYSIRNVASGKVLDVKDGSIAAGANVQQWDANGSKAQQWRFVDAGNGEYFIQSRANGLYLDIANGSAQNGANVQVYTLNKSNAQKFKLTAVKSVDTVQNGNYQIHSALAGQSVLDIANGSSSNGANVQLYSANGTAAQTFEIKSGKNGYCTIVNRNSGKALDVSGAGLNAGTNVQQWTSNGTLAQQWLFVDAGNGYYYIQSACNGLYLDVSAGSSKNGTNIQVYTANKSNAQKFKLVKLEDSQKIQEGVYTIQSALGANKVLDVLNGSKSNGGNIQIYSSNGTPAQKFKIESAGNGNYRIRNVNSGMVLDVTNAGLDAGTNVQQWTSNGTFAQQWRFVDAGNGYYYIQSVCNGLYLDVSAGSTKNGTNVQVYTANQSTAQKFKLVKQ